MSEVTNVSLVGVGGQGILLAAEVLCHVAALTGKDVKKSEVHGMAQRGGSVVSHVRIGDRVLSPLVATGATDILVGFEKLEALRFAHFLRADGAALVSDHEIRPVSVASGESRWPEDLDARLSAALPKLEWVPALRLARELGQVRAVNTVMLGALSHHLNADAAVWRAALTEVVPPKVLDVNLRAFEAGRGAVCRSA